MKGEKAICAAFFVFLLAAISGCAQPAPPSGGGGEIEAVKSVQLPEGWRVDFKQGAQLEKHDLDDNVLARADFSNPGALCKINVMGVILDPSAERAPKFGVIFYSKGDFDRIKARSGIVASPMPVAQTQNYTVVLLRDNTVCDEGAMVGELAGFICEALNQFVISKDLFWEQYCKGDLWGM